MPDSLSTALSGENRETLEILLGLVATGLFGPLVAGLEHYTKLVGELVRPNFLIAVMCIGSAFALAAWLEPGMTTKEIVIMGLAATGSNALIYSGTKAGIHTVRKNKGDHSK